jgi:hypothetical protein
VKWIIIVSCLRPVVVAIFLALSARVGRSPSIRFLRKHIRCWDVREGGGRDGDRPTRAETARNIATTTGRRHDTIMIHFTSSTHLTSTQLTSTPSHLTQPHLTSPKPNPPHLNSPHPTQPQPQPQPQLNSTHRASHYITSPHITSPHLTSFPS